MSSLPQLSNHYPATLHDWERTLTKALLSADEGNSDAIRSFEITPETLAEHCGLSVDHAAGAEQAFKLALTSDPSLTRCLQHGVLSAPNSDVPNCMAFLALSLLVDSLLDGTYEGNGQYRVKLAQWLGIDRSFMDLRGISAMWEELVAWLDTRIDAGVPLRRLVLPQIPVTWTHIGYTRYLSFPTKRDLHFLRKQIERSPQSANDPAAIVRLLDRNIRASAVSFGLKSAFEDFRVALRSGAASVDHRFWRLVIRAKELSGSKEDKAAELRMEFDEDGGRNFRLSTPGTSGFSISSDIGSATAATIVLESSNLGPSVRRGVLFFRSSGLASWTAAGEPPSGTGPFHLAVTDQHFRIATGISASFERSGTWHVTNEPISHALLFDFLRRLGIQRATETVRTIGLVDGVRVGKCWLGLPRYMPHLEGATDEVEITPVARSEPFRLSWADGQLKADGPIEGEFMICDRSARWSRRATFVSVAEVHASMDGANYSLPVLEEWQPNRSPSIKAALPIGIHWDERDYPHQDVLEALYASLRSGCSEGEAAAVVDRAMGRRCWDMLRTLQESTFLDARLRQQWRGRVFTLGHQALIEVRINNTPGIVVAGAVPLKIEGDFHKTVLMQGGRAFRRLSPDSLAPPLFGAIQVDIRNLSDALGWPIVAAPTSPEGTAARRLCETKVVGNNYQIASAWDWSLGRFRTGTEGSGQVLLVRLIHPAGRDHDLYRVTGNRERTFTSRTAAIVDAYIQAGRPLFRREGGLIRRLTAEGALPIELSKALRLRALMNGGGSDKGWEYTLAPQDEPWIAGLLPGLVEGVGSPDMADPTMKHRRGRGARRPVWMNGRFTA